MPTEIAKAAIPSLATLNPPPANKLLGLIAGEDIAAFDACYIGSDGLVHRSSGAAANAAAKVRGYAAQAAKAAQGDPVTLLSEVDVEYAAGTLTPGQDLYLSATVPGGLVDTATTGGTSPCAFAVTASRVRLRKFG